MRLDAEWMLFFIQHSKLWRRISGALLEGTGKSRAAGKARLIWNICNTQLRIWQERLGIIYSCLLQILIKSHARIITENSFKMIFTKACIIGNALKGYVFGKVLWDVSAHIAQRNAVLKWSRTLGGIWSLEERNVFCCSRSPLRAASSRCFRASKSTVFICFSVLSMIT